MAKWDQDIHRIHEIQQLLESRQHYFHEHSRKSTYKSNLSNVVQPTKPHFVKRHPDSTQLSVGHSAEANFGSIETTSENARTVPTINGILSDLSDGNFADRSQDESSDASDTKGETNARKKKVMKNAKVLRKWVTKNLEAASLASVPNKQSIKAPDDSILRKTSIVRFKSISSDGGPLKEIPATNQAEPLLNAESSSPVLSHPKKKKTPNPIKLLRQRSWILKAELASRLNEDTNNLNLNKVVTDLTKSSISHARQKLRKAEKSLRATVKNQDNIPVTKKKLPAAPSVVSFQANKPSPTPKPRPSNKAGLSRLALRQQEEALRSDLNLREAFALIKINPDPLLELASAENDFRPVPLGRKSVKFNEHSGEALGKQKLRESKHKGESTSESSKTTLSLRRLTKLSIQHLQKQQSLIPSSVQPLHTQKGKKEMNQRLKSILVEKEKLRGENEFRPLEHFGRRKSSTTSTVSSKQATSVNLKKRSQDLGNRRMSILPTYR